MNETTDDRSLWTAWCDYCATGEGRSTMACICYASSSEQMRSHFIERFGDWFAKGCEIQKGVQRNDVTCFLWSEAILEAMEDCERNRARVDAHSWMHFNFS